MRQPKRRLEVIGRTPLLSLSYLFTRGPPFWNGLGMEVAIRGRLVVFAFKRSNGMRYGRTFLALVTGGTVLAGSGCDETGVGLAGDVRARAVVRDDPGASAPAFSGTLATNANVSVSVDGQSWVDLGSPNGITIQLQSRNDSTNVHGEVDIPAGTYRHVRLTLRESQVTVKEGSSVGGTTLSADVNLTIGGAGAEVEIRKEVPSFTASDLTVISFDLNSRTWLTTQTLQSGVVAAAQVQQATTVMVRSLERP